MTPLMAWLKRTTEKAFGRYYEGPEPPARLGNMAEHFAATYPRATRGEWLTMARRLAAEAYREGYVRGYEKYERDPAEREQHDPDELAEVMRHDWDWAGPTGVDLMLSEVPEDDLTERAAQGGWDAYAEHLEGKVERDRARMGKPRRS